MVSPWIRDLLLYGSIALAAGAVLVFYARDAPAKVPAATALGDRAHAARRWIVRIAPWPALIGGAIAAIWIYTQSTEIVIVTDDGARVSARRMVKLGSAPGPDERADRAALSDPVWVLNESSHVLRVETVQYGRAFFAVPTKTIAPHTVELFTRVDDIGPDDPPPKTVDDESGMRMADRAWLTWDR